MQKEITANREAWNRWAEVHEGSAFYDLDGFRKNPASLKSIELEALGDVRGKSLLHLQCHIGVDTLSWARLGAAATGVDISDKAVDIGRSLSRELEIPADFVCCDVHDLRSHLDARFDIVFTSYGVLWWIPDLGEWARLVRDFLKPGGTFYIVEFHPLVFMLDDEGTRLRYSYFAGEVLEERATGTYADRDAAVETVSYGWQHSLGEVTTALIGAGLEIEGLEEYGYSPYDCFPFTVETGPGRYGIRGLEDQVPLLFSIRARNPQDAI